MLLFQLLMKTSDPEAPEHTYSVDDVRLLAELFLAAARGLSKVLLKLAMTEGEAAQLAVRAMAGRY